MKATRIAGGFIAKYPGTCGKCGQSISIGDHIRQNGAGKPAVGYYGSRRYSHINCGVIREATGAVERAEVAAEVAADSKPQSPFSEQVSRWVEVVQSTRRLAAEHKAQFVISPRASIKGAQLLRAGVSPADTVEAIFGRYRHVEKWQIVGTHAEQFARISSHNNAAAETRWAARAARCGKTQHVSFGKLVMLASALANEDKNIWLAGPAGSGKTTAARNLATAMGYDVETEFDFNGAIDTEYKLSGFVDAKGRVVSTAFRKIWENGGVYLFDECDASMAGALLAFNAALANGYAAFPDGTIKRHEKTVIVAAANTWGFGGDANYVGRAKLDAAFLDRFVTLTWNYDESLERKIALGDAA